MTLAAKRTLDEGALTDLRLRLRGVAVSPSDDGYDEARKVWNGSIDRRPAVIARCADVDDVAAAVRFAADRELIVAVRGGGHSFPGLSVCDDGLVVDFALMKGIRIDPERRTVSAQAGVLLGELDAATQAVDRAVPAGIVTHTGLAGLTLGGGIGWLHRKHGLTIDNLESVDLVTAAGDRIRASESENADLFWGVRGGGGNFGIVTEFTFRLASVGPYVVAGPVFWRMQDAPEVLRFYRDWIADCPDELMTIVVERKMPALDGVPAELVGERIIGVVSCHSGDVEEGERVVRPLKAFGSPVLDLCQPKPFVAHQASLDPGFKPGWWYYVRSCDVAALSDEVIDIVAEHGMRIGSPISSLALWQMGGAVARVDDAATAFNGRTAGHTFNINGNSMTEDGFEEARQWARDFWTALAPHHTSVYVNFLMEEGKDRVRQAYGDAKYDRLKALKTKYDPTNFFRLNQNIKPN
ncbi:MAG: FAD-binding oxidoreductase [Mycobacteriales bacterium]